MAKQASGLTFNRQSASDNPVNHVTLVQNEGKAQCDDTNTSGKGARFEVLTAYRSHLSSFSHDSPSSMSF